MPQVAAGAQYKSADQGAVIGLLGGQHDRGVDYYVAATKVLLDESLVLNGTVRATKANQTGLLGFGGDRNDDYHAAVRGLRGAAADHASSRSASNTAPSRTT